MCGIAGIYHLTAGEPPSQALLGAMIARIRYRGPDDEGYHVGQRVGLGSCRLAIVDIEHGRQPMYSDDRRIISICNGEIYNHLELRRDLESLGHRFHTRCDVEVLIPLYRRDGHGFVERLNGQFAFALYDEDRHRLMLGRDPMGICPLFYTQVGGTLIFASEIKAILEHPAVERAVDLRGLDQILTFPGLASPQTMFRGINSVPPGHVLLAENGRVEVRPYWDLDYPDAEAIDRRWTEAKAAEALEHQLRQAVQRRLQADVPVGYYLSGGLDSSLLAALIHDLSGEARHSFSIRFPEPDIDEGRFQALMVQQLHSLHHETRFDAEAISERLRAIVFHAETPLKESYNTCSLALSRLVSDTGMKVVLTGEGSDELLGGYVGYRLDQQRSRSAAESADLPLLLEQELQATLWGDPRFFYEKPYYAHRDTRAALYSAGVNEHFQSIDCTRQPLLDPRKLARLHAFHRRSYIDCKLRLADHLLADHGDRVAYANSVEARYPYLDQELIKLIRTLPPDLLLKDGVEKSLLKRVARRYLPERIVERQKFAFVAPGSPRLLQQGIDWIEDLLSADRIARQGYFSPDTVERLKARCRKPGFALNTTFEDDWLMIVLTFGILLDTFHLPDFRG